LLAISTKDTSGQDAVLEELSRPATLLAPVSGLLARSRDGQMRSLRLVGFALVWLVSGTVALAVLAGPWVVSGFGGRCAPSRIRAATARSRAGS
jgi:hypothetical protein